MKRIAIVGGGPSGLFSAFRLEQRSGEPLDITLFEAEPTLGGKVQTRQFSAAPVPYEAGVAELYRYGDDPLWRLVTQDLGLPTIPMAGGTVVFEGHVLHDDTDIARSFGEATADAIAEFRRRARGARPFDNFYNGSWPDDNHHPWINLSLRGLLDQIPDEVARRFLQIFIHSDLATEPQFTHGLYGVDNYLINESDYCQLYSVRGGISRVIEALAAQISARVLLGAPVNAVERSESGAYRVGFEQGGRALSEEFDVVIVALPIYALRRLSWGERLVRRAVEAHVSSYEEPAHYLRITALFQEPFWRRDFHDAWFIHDAFGGCCVYDEGARYDAGGYGVLSWLLAGNDALAMSRHSEGALVEAALRSLPPAIADAEQARRLFLEGHVNRWIGMVYGMPAGRPIKGSKKRHYPEPEDHKDLVLVGDYLFDSTINGAFDSANIASRLVARRLGLASPKSGRAAPA